MSTIRAVLLLLLLQPTGCAVVRAADDAQPNRLRTDQSTVFTAHRPDKLRRPARIRAVKRGPGGEPVLPDRASNPKPATVADRPDPVSLRRRKLRLRHRT